MPEIKNLKVQSIELDCEETRIECLDVLLELHYKGNFRGCIEADMVLGKKGSLTLTGKLHISYLNNLPLKYIIQFKNSVVRPDFSLQGIHTIIGH